MLTYCVYAPLLNLIDALPLNVIYNFEIASKENIMDFHQNEKLGTPDISLKMKRSFVETVSITSFKKEDCKVGMLYFDFIKDAKSLISV